MVQIEKLNIYPVKSLQGISLQQAELTVRGFRYDRNWMITDQDGRFLTQREVPSFATIQVDLMDNGLRLTAKSGEQLDIPFDGKNREIREAEIWGDQCKAFDEGDLVSDWLTDFIGTVKGSRLRLVRIHDGFRRNVDPDHLKKGEDPHTAFADGYPYLITSVSSLNRLNNKLIESGADEVPMDRFRPNIVIGGTEPFAENRLEELASEDGSYRLGLRKPCKRCKVTTVDQKAGTISNPAEPLRTLTEMRTVPELHGAYFGQNAILLSAEGVKVRVGDQLFPNLSLASSSI